MTDTSEITIEFDDNISIRNPKSYKKVPNPKKQKLLEKKHKERQQSVEKRKCIKESISTVSNNEFIDEHDNIWFEQEKKQVEEKHRKEMQEIWYYFETEYYYYMTPQYRPNPFR